MMPDHRRRTEGDDVAGLLQPPAKIDVVPGFAKIRIEAADRLECPAVEGHVATGNVLSHGVGQEDVTRTARSSCDTGLHPVIRRRREVRPADSGVIATEECSD